MERQIKNLVGTAHALALDSESPLCVEHVDAVLDIASNWSYASTAAQQATVTY